jgi:hypothetical protein
MVPGYIFSGNSLFGPNLTDSGSIPTDLTASDIAASGIGYFLGGGASIDLGEVLFDVSPTTPTEMANVQFVSGIFNTDLSDPSGGNIPINTETGGTIEAVSRHTGQVGYSHSPPQEVRGWPMQPTSRYPGEEG